MIVETIYSLQNISYIANEKIVFETAKLDKYTTSMSKCVILDCDGMKRYIKENKSNSDVAIVDKVFCNLMSLKQLQNKCILHIFLGNVKIKDCLKYKSLVELFSSKLKDCIFDKIYLHECPYFIDEFFSFFKYLIREDVKNKIIFIKKSSRIKCTELDVGISTVI
jgi:hypothetical protein